MSVNVGRTEDEFLVACGQLTAHGGDWGCQMVWMVWGWGTRKEVTGDGGGGLINGHRLASYEVTELWRMLTV